MARTLASAGDRAGPLAAAALAVIAAGTAFRLAVAALMPLGLDEAYAVAVARGYPLAFYDHPPLGFWAGVVVADLTGWEHPLAYRLPAVLLGTVTAVAIWRLGTMLGGPLAGLWAAALHAVAPHLVLGGGVMVVPDAPLNAALAWLAVVLAGFAREPGAPGIGAWAGAGVLFALALASKYQAGFAALAVLGWLAADPARRHWLATPGPWIGAAVGALGFLPVILWNAANGWPTVTFHGARITGTPDPLNLLAMTGGQVLYLLPPVMVLCVLGMLRAARRGAPGAERLLLWLAAVPVGCLSLIYLFGTYSFPHWTMPGWLMALPLAGAWAASATDRARRRARNWVAGFAVPVWAVGILGAVQLATGVLTRGMETPPAWDASVGLYDWRPLGPALAADGWLDGVAVLMAPGWIDAGLMATALGGSMPMRVPGGPPNAHHFAFLPGEAMRGPTLLLSPGTMAEGPARLAAARALAEAEGATVERAAILRLPRGGRPHAAVAALRLTYPPALTPAAPPAAPPPP
jgi:4-amino-4-deoxy-L-arabinose transferase-like glycosyltransferase